MKKDPTDEALSTARETSSTSSAYPKAGHQNAVKAIQTLPLSSTCMALASAWYDLPPITTGEALIL